MALRIKTNDPVAEPEVEQPVEEPTEAAPPQEAIPAPEPQGGMVDPIAARYFGPESRCAGCVHFMEGPQGGSCEIVSGPIDPQGVCSLFMADQMDDPLATEAIPAAEPPTDIPSDAY
jgi:hypothetical protein